MKVQKIKNVFHLLEAVVASIFYGFPSKKLKVIGVTGTDGKTTTSHLIYHILKTAGKKVSLISSVYADIAGSIHETGLHTTTPHPFEIQKYIRQAYVSGDEYFVLETTSHAMDQYRVWGIRFYCGVLTNVTHEHLDYHHTYDEYMHTKAKILYNSDTVIINRDDSSFEKIKALLPHKKIISYGIKKKAGIAWDFLIHTTLLGAYNKENILASYACCISLGISKESLYRGIASFTLPKGRFEMVYDGDFKVIIDFAHTPYAIERLLSTIKKEILGVSSGRLIHIFGSAGLRDETKRPKMGRASVCFADIIILTEEDHRTERVEDICDQIMKGVKKSEKKPLETFIIYSRDDAIKKGISIAQKGDVVVITGKGHEKSLCRGHKEYPWSDHEAVKNALS